MALVSETPSIFSEHVWIRDLNTKRHRYLDALDGAVPWRQLIRSLKPIYPTGERGRNPIPLESMIRLHVYQLSCELSDQQAIDDMVENRLVEAFCAWDITQRPSLHRSTLGRFRKRIKTHAQDTLFAEVVAEAHRLARLERPTH
ncbi:MAG: transposase [Gammaproteobacteria bacterium]|nr:transposase [Gammaproteobacteria bacterium]